MRIDSPMTSVARLSPTILLLSLALLSSPASAQQAERTFRGFRVGEEVRYAFERDGEEAGDRIVHWGITLLQVHDGGEEATFEFNYLLLVANQRLAQAIAEARVNANGFPLQVRFGSERITALGNIGYTIEYRFEDGEYRKELVESGLDVQEIELQDHPGIDVRARRGVYLYNPVDAACAAAFADAQPIVDDTTSGGPGEVVIEQQCGGRELIFANPGLLDLTMPALWDTGTGALDFVALAPTGMRLELLTQPVDPSGGVSVGGMNLLGFLSGGPDPFNDGELALQPFALRSASDLLQIELGDRTIDGWRLATPAPFADVYVDGNGSIVRLDLPGTTAEGGAAWLRKLRPSEF